MILILSFLLNFFIYNRVITIYFHKKIYLFYKKKKKLYLFNTFIVFLVI